MTLTWQNGRQLSTLSKEGLNVSYVYNDEGLRTQKTVNGVITEYYWNGSQLLGQKTGTSPLHFLYDERGLLVGFNDGTKTYLYTRNLQGEIISVTDTYTGTTVANYVYDSWGNVLTATGVMADVNPIRYKGYYYDSEIGLYYLQTRYYDSQVGRFINADSFVSTGQDLTGFNMYAYCGNNPVSRVDESGQGWLHWLVTAAVVVVAAAAVVVTAGGAAAGIAAVASVSCGVAAATTASTVAAGAFLGAATVAAGEVIGAALTSKSADEFAEKGNWGTVGGTLVGGALGGMNAYSMMQRQKRPIVMSETSASPKSVHNSIASRGSTAVRQPANLSEQLALEQVKSNPQGVKLPITMSDSRWPASEGWVKMQQIVPTAKGNVIIHYVYSPLLQLYDDFKLK